MQKLSLREVKLTKDMAPVSVSQIPHDTVKNCERSAVC